MELGLTLGLCWGYCSVDFIYNCTEVVPHPVKQTSVPDAPTVLPVAASKSVIVYLHQQAPALERVFQGRVHTVLPLPLLNHLVNMISFVLMF